MVSEPPAARFPKQLADGVAAVGPGQIPVGNHRPRRCDLVVLPACQLAVGFIVVQLVTAHRAAAAHEHHPPNAGFLSALVYVERAHDGDGHRVFPIIRAGVGGQVQNHVHSWEGRLDRLAITDIGL